jgi:signal transduction histidine kinase
VLHGGPDFLPTGFEHAVCIRDNHQERFYLPHALAIRADGELLGAALVLTDVTRFRLLDQLKSDMVSTVSHELKTPLTSLQMAIHLLLEEVVGPLSPKQVELLLAARQDTDRLLTMVNDLLDLTRIEQGRVRLDLQPISAETLARQAVDRATPSAREARVSIELVHSAADAKVLADLERIKHVFDNLISNAISHSPENGTVRLTISRAPGSGAVEYAVIDEAEGIAPEHLPHIFEKFYRVPGSPPSGAGLGLAIVREIVTAHGGEISVQSQPGRGTTFLFTLPEAFAPAPVVQAGGTLS